MFNVEREKMPKRRMMRFMYLWNGAATDALLGALHVPLRVRAATGAVRRGFPHGRRRLRPVGAEGICVRDL